jgi:hypothetical protein
MVMFRYIFGFLPLIRTFRSTGSKASIVLILDESAHAKLTNNHFYQLKNCGVKIYNIGSVLYENIQSTSYGFIFDYVLKNQKYISRILMTNAFDVIFQGDPFTEDIKTDTLYFGTEKHFIFQNEFMMSGIKKLPFPHRNYSHNNRAINSGRFIGGTLPFMKMMDLYFSLFTKQYWGMNWDDDQAVINYMVYTGLMAQNNISFVVDGPTRFTDSIPLGKLRLTPNHQIGYVPDIDDRKNYATIVHQYDRCPLLTYTILRACPQGTYEVNDFVRKRKRVHRKYIKKTPSYLYKIILFHENYEMD